VLARLASHVGGLSSLQVMHFVTESDEVGRMMGGWLRHGGDRRADATGSRGAGRG